MAESNLSAQLVQIASLAIADSGTRRWHQRSWKSNNNNFTPVPQTLCLYLLLHGSKSDSLALKCLFMHKSTTKKSSPERETDRIWISYINMQYYVSDLNYMNHLLKLIRETERSRRTDSVLFAHWWRVMLHLRWVYLEIMSVIRPLEIISHCQNSCDTWTSPSVTSISFPSRWIRR